MKSARWGLPGQALPGILLFWRNAKGSFLADIRAHFTMLNLEEQVTDLVDNFRISTRLTTWEALVGGEDKV